MISLGLEHLDDCPLLGGTGRCNCGALQIRLITVLAVLATMAFLGLAVRNLVVHLTPGVIDVQD